MSNAEPPEEPSPSPPTNASGAREPRSGALLAAGALVFAGLWFGAWSMFAGRSPLHANDTVTLARFGPREAPFLLTAMLVEGVLGAWLTTLFARRWPSGLDARWRELIEKPGVTRIAFALVVAIIGALVGVALLDGHPITEDEKTYLYQAELLLHGRLSDPVPPEARSFLQPFIVDLGGRWTGQYFWGQPALLALGLLVHAPALVGPFEAAITVVFTGKLAAEYTDDARAGVVAAGLAAVSPIVALSAGTMHSGNLSAACAAASLWGLARLAKGPGRWAALALGVSTGVALHNRVLDHAALLLGAGALMAVRYRRDVRGLVRALGPAVLVSLPFVVLLPILNTLAWGGPLITGYALFNASRGWVTMGFGHGTSDTPHSVAYAAAKTMAVLVRLAFFETGSPLGFALLALPVIGVVRRSARSVAPIVLVLVYAVAYFFYAGSSIDPTGPVYYLGLTPLLLAWIAIVAVELHDRLGAVVAKPPKALTRFVPAFLCAQAVSAFIVFWPAQILYLAGSVAQARDCEDTARSANIERGLVFTLTTWSATWTSTWHVHAPLMSPPFDAPVLFASARGTAEDLAAVRRFAGDRPVFLERCLSERSRVYRYDPAERTIRDVDGRNPRLLERAPNLPAGYADYGNVLAPEP